MHSEGAAIGRLVERSGAVGSSLERGFPGKSFWWVMIHLGSIVGFSGVLSDLSDSGVCFPSELEPSLAPFQLPDLARNRGRIPHLAQDLRKSRVWNPALLPSRPFGITSHGHKSPSPSPNPTELLLFPAAPVPALPGRRAALSRLSPGWR